MQRVKGAEGQGLQRVLLQEIQESRDEVDPGVQRIKWCRG